MVVVFNDAITEYEISSDSYKSEETEFFLIIHGKLIKTTEENYDIGANAAQEATEEDEGFEKFEMTYPDCAGAGQGQSHVDAGLTSKKQVKKALMDYVKNLAKCERLSAEEQTAFKKACQRKLDETELAEQQEKGSQATNAIGKAIHDEFLANFSDDQFQVVVAHQDEYSNEGMLMGFFQYGQKPGDAVRLCIWKHGITKEAF